MDYYTAKFTRERKDHPQHWLILPAPHGRCRLEYVGPCHAA